MKDPGRPTWMRVQEVAAQLSAVSREHQHDVYTIFDWPDSLPADAYWMSPELTSCYGTDVWDSLSEPQRIRLSQHEAVNFFSLSVHLIQDLIGEVADRIYTTRYPGLSEFFHDFIREENEHMWFFAQFCNRYGDKLYPSKELVSSSSDTGVARDLMVFGRIMIAEELCDIFNARMAADHRLPPIVRQVNAVHHDDESRHIAFGRQMVRALCEDATQTCSAEQLSAAAQYLARYVSVCLRTFYNPAAYIDAGLPNARAMRSKLLVDPARHAVHRDLMRRTVSFLDRVGAIDIAALAW